MRHLNRNGALLKDTELAYLIPKTGFHPFYTCTSAQGFGPDVENDCSKQSSKHIKLEIIISVPLKMSKYVYTKET